MIINKLYNRLSRINIIKKRSILQVHQSVKLNGVTVSGHITIDEGSKIEKGVNLNGLKLISIGRYTTLNGPNTDVYSRIHEVKIGNFCSIARNVSIQEYNHKIDRISTYFMDTNVFNEKSIDGNIYSNGTIEIRNDVWIGAHSVILSGAVIDNGAIVGANSVVTGYIPPYAIVAGIPAKVIKYRFTPQIIDLLMQIKWWDWEIEKIRKNENLFKNTLDVELLRSIIK